MVILFFSLTVLLAVQLFTQAQVKSLRSERENHAMLRAQSAVEQLEGFRPDGTEALSAVLSGCGDGGQIYYDKEWNVTTEADAAYQMAVSFLPEETGAGQMVTLDVTVTYLRDGHAPEELVALRSGYYLPRV